MAKTDSPLNINRRRLLVSAVALPDGIGLREVRALKPGEIVWDGARIDAALAELGQ